MSSSLSTERPTPTRLLVSVRDPEEALLAKAAGADLVDAKDPAQGALGALPVECVRAIRASVGGAPATSAVAGEPVTGSDLVASIVAMAATGVDFVKVAVTEGHDEAALARAAAAAPARLIGVLFAEDGIAPDAVMRLAAAGFCGAMIDTRGKDGRRLTDHLAPQALTEFVSACAARSLLSGLAGSLRVEDVPMLAALGPGYLGFRGGLCRDGDRRNPLDAKRVVAAARALRTARSRDAA